MMNESNLVRFFGNSPFIKILDVFIDNIGSDFSKKQVQELSGLSKASLFQHWEKLEELKLVKVTRVFGKSKLYTLNTESQTVKDLIKMELNLIEQTSPALEKTMKQKILARAR